MRRLTDFYGSLIAGYQDMLSRRAGLLPGGPAKPPPMGATDVTAFPGALSITAVMDMVRNRRERFHLRTSAFPGWLGKLTTLGLNVQAQALTHNMKGTYPDWFHWRDQDGNHKDGVNKYGPRDAPSPWVCCYAEFPPAVSYDLKGFHAGYWANEVPNAFMNLSPVDANRVALLDQDQNYQSDPFSDCAKWSIEEYQSAWRRAKFAKIENMGETWMQRLDGPGQAVDDWLRNYLKMPRTDTFGWMMGINGHPYIAGRRPWDWKNKAERAAQINWFRNARWLVWACEMWRCAVGQDVPAELGARPIGAGSDGRNRLIHDDARWLTAAQRETLRRWRLHCSAWGVGYRTRERYESHPSISDGVFPRRVSEKGKVVWRGELVGRVASRGNTEELIPRPWINPEYVQGGQRSCPYTWWDVAELLMTHTPEPGTIPPSQAVSDFRLCRWGDSYLGSFRPQAQLLEGYGEMVLSSFFKKGWGGVSVSAAVKGDKGSEKFRKVMVRISVSTMSAVATVVGNAAGAAASAALGAAIAGASATVQVVLQNAVSILSTYGARVARVFATTGNIEADVWGHLDTAMGELDLGGLLGELDLGGLSTADILALQESLPTAAQRSAAGKVASVIDGLVDEDWPHADDVFGGVRTVGKVGEAMDEALKATE